MPREGQGYKTTGKPRKPAVAAHTAGSIRAGADNPNDWQTVRHPGYPAQLPAPPVLPTCNRFEVLQEAQEEDTTEKEQLEPSARPNRRRRRTQKKQKEQGRTVGQTEPTRESGDEPGPSQEGRDLRRTSGFPPAGSSSASSAEQEEAQTARPAELGGEPGAGSRSNIDGRDLGRTSGFPLVGYGSARSAGPGKSQAARQAVLGETPEGDMDISQEGRDWRGELSSAGADWPYSRLPH